MTLAIVTFAGYAGFFATPFGGSGQGDFTPELVAEREAALWQSARAGEEFGTFVNAVLLERERHRYSWFRSAESGYYRARAATTFAKLRERYQRVLPDLEAVAEIHRTWTGAEFSPTAVAQAELSWWVTRRLPNLNSLDQVAPLIEREYELRYGLRGGAASDAATRRAEAALMFDASDTDPNIPAITKMLTESYTSLRRVLIHDNRPRD